MRDIQKLITAERLDAYESGLMDATITIKVMAEDYKKYAAEKEAQGSDQQAKEAYYIGAVLELAALRILITGDYGKSKE